MHRFIYCMDLINAFILTMSTNTRNLGLEKVLGRREIENTISAGPSDINYIASINTPYERDMFFLSIMLCMKIEDED